MASSHMTHAYLKAFETIVCRRFRGNVTVDARMCSERQLSRLQQWISTAVETRRVAPVTGVIVILRPTYDETVYPRVRYR